MATKKPRLDEEDEPNPSSSSASHYHASDSLRQQQHRPVVHNLAPPAGGDDPGDGEDETAADEEDIGNLLEHLSRDQLVSLLRSAAAIDHATAVEIRRVTDLEPANRNIFVHQLAWGTTDEVLRAAFARYGEIDDCRVILDKDPGRSKGYGFVLFRNRSAALRALREPQKFIHNRMTSCHLASRGPSSAASGYGDLSQHQNPDPIFGSTVQQDKLRRKIYVGNVHSGVDGSRLRKFFSQFGVIEEGPIGFDRLTGKPKGYALFIYKTVEGANKALEEPNKNFEGHQLICQKWTDGKAKRPVANAATTLQNASSNMGTYNAAVYGGASTPDIGLAQQTAMFGHSFLGMTAPQAFEQGIQRNAAAVYEGASTPDMGLAQQAAMFGHGLLGMSAPQAFGQGMQPNAAAVYGGASTPDMGLAQQAAMFGHGLPGMTAPQAFGQGMRPNATALAMLAAQTQNPAALGITPVMLASPNPPLATALGTAGAHQAMAIPSVSQTIPARNFAMGTVGFQGAQEFQGSPKYQRSPGFRGPTGFQGSPVLQEPPGLPGPPGFQGTRSVARQGAAANRGTYQMAGTVPTAVPNQHTGSTGGYGIH